MSSLCTILKRIYVLSSFLPLKYQDPALFSFSSPPPGISPFFHLKTECLINSLVLLVPCSDFVVPKAGLGFLGGIFFWGGEVLGLIRNLLFRVLYENANILGSCPSKENPNRKASWADPGAISNIPLVPVSVLNLKQPRAGWGEGSNWAQGLGTGNELDLVRFRQARLGNEVSTPGLSSLKLSSVFERRRAGCGAFTSWGGCAA